MGCRIGQGRRIARTVIRAVAIGLLIAPTDSATAFQQQPPAPAEGRASLGGMRLLAGYRHEYKGGGDSCTGAIRKDDNVRIGYDVGTNAGDHARAFAKRPGVAWSKTQQVGNSTLQITMTRDRLLIATVGGFANFSVHNADEQTLVDLLLMLATYDLSKHIMAGCI